MNPRTPPCRPSPVGLRPEDNGQTGRHPQRRTLLAGLAALTLAPTLAACGGGGGDAGTPPPAATAPALDIRSDVNGEARSIFTITFFFSDAVRLPNNNLAFSLSGGSLVAGSFTQLNDRTYSVRVRPNASARGLVDLRVPPGAFTDIEGRVSNTVAYAFAQPYDTLPPLVTLTFGGPTNALGLITGPGTFTVTFSGVLDAPLANGVLRGGEPGTISALTKTSATGQPDVYTFTYTPPTNTFGIVGFVLPADSVTRNGIGNDTELWNFGISTGP